MCANTVHLVADTIRQRISIPLLHSAEETAREIVSQKISKVALLGTKFTMDSPFFNDRLAQAGISVVSLDEADKAYMHESIFSELTKGIFRDDTRKRYIDIIDRLKRDGAEGIIFGSAEFALLLTPADCSIPIFDTIAIHANAAVDFALS